MARVVFVCVLVFGLFAQCSANETRLLELLRDILDRTDFDSDVLSERDLGELNKASAKAVGPFNEANTFFINVFKRTMVQSKKDRKAELTLICDNLVEGKVKKSLIALDTLYKDVKKKIGRQRSLDLEDELDLDGWDVFNDLLHRRDNDDQPVTKAQVEAQRDEIVKAINDFVDTGKEAVSKADKKTLKRIRASIIGFYGKVGKIKTIRGYFKTNCLNDEIIQAPQ